MLGVMRFLQPNNKVVEPMIRIAFIAAMLVAGGPIIYVWSRCVGGGNIQG